MTPFAIDVARGLQGRPKQLAAHYLYDTLGSSLFDAICRLPWYGITRGEARLLARHGDELARAVAKPSSSRVVITELGAGNGEKLAAIVGALPAGAVRAVRLIDVSPAALDAAGARLAQVRQVPVVKCQGTFEEGLQHLAQERPDDARMLVLFLGSNIGNFDADGARSLLRAVHRVTVRGDFLLLGADLVKPVADLLIAYDDPLGVTAAFNKNLLVRINRELDGAFDLATFDHRACWNDAEQRVEMHLVSRVAQEVAIAGAGLTASFEAGESIWTESSYKYTEAAIAGLGAACGFEPAEQWVDAGTRFALTLFTVS